MSEGGGKRQRAKATNWVNMSVHKQSRTPKPAMTHWGGEISTHVQAERLWGVCKHTHTHTQSHT